MVDLRFTLAPYLSFFRFLGTFFVSGVLLILFSAPHPARAEEEACLRRAPPASIWEPPQGLIQNCYLHDQTLFVHGVFGDKALRALREFDVRKVWINSPGGNTSKAEKAAEIIRSKNMTTEIPAGGYCYSSCTLVFQAGVERIAHTSSKLFYHCIGLGPFGYRIVAQQCGPDLTKYSPQCKKDVEDLSLTTIQSTEKYFENYEKYDALGLSEHLFAQPDSPDWFESGNFCKKNFPLSAEESMRFNVVQILKR